MTVHVMAPPTATTVAGGPGQLILGGYYSYDGAVGEQAFITQIGGNPAKSIVMMFAGQSDTWTNTFNSALGMSTMSSWPGLQCLALGMQTSDNPLLWTDVTGGGQDAGFNTVINWAVSNMKRGSIIRLGWELNGGWFPWGIGGNDTTANQNGFKNTWIHIWNLFHAIAPGYFKFMWNPTIGNSAFSTDMFTSYYPGDQYVDIVGADIYNNVWNSWPGDAAFLTLVNTSTPPAWQDFVTFARAHNKAISLPEWGLWPFSNTPGTSNSPGDDPTFVTNIFSLVVPLAQAGMTVYLWPWDDVNQPWSMFPNSLARLTTLVATYQAQGLIAS